MDNSKRPKKPKRARRDPPVQPFDRKAINRRSFIAFAGFIGAGLLGWKGWKWLSHSPAEPHGITGGAQRPLRKALENNETVFKQTFSNNHLVKTYPKSMAAAKVRVNSDIGMEDDDFDPAQWNLQLKRANGRVDKITLDEIRALPKTEIVFDFKCVEGWDQISWWGGVKFSDFITHFNLQQEAAMKYVGMATPDEGYYVGVEMPAALHPQTILAYEVNGQLLPPQHGQPLRLIIPVKYGIKNIKRIGSMHFSNERPRDYWAEEGYDYYSGL